MTRLRNRLVAGLQAHFGSESEKLIEFGISPRKRSRRRREEPPPPAASSAPPATEGT